MQKTSSTPSNNNGGNTGTGTSSSSNNNNNNNSTNANQPASSSINDKQLPSASGACSPSGSQNFVEQRVGRNVTESPEPHAFRPVVLASFMPALDSGNNQVTADFCTDEAAYNGNLSNSFRSWEQNRRTQQSTNQVFTSTFDSNALSREFFRSTAESLYAQFDPHTFGLSRNGANPNLQTCGSPSFESSFEALVNSQNAPSNAFCSLSAGEHYTTFASPHNATSSNHFISASNVLNLPSTSQLQYGQSAYSSVFGGFSNAQQGVRNANATWTASSSNSGANSASANVAGSGSQNVADSSHDHNMNATTYQLFCTANNVDPSRISMVDQLPLQVSGLPVTSRLEDGSYIVSIVHDPSNVNNVGSSALSVADDNKVMAQLSSNMPPLADLDYDPRELEQFAEKFKQRRIKLGVTQSDVGKMLDQLKIPGVGPLSQSTICRFESLTLSHNNMIALKPVLQAWLDYAEMQALEKHKNSNDPSNSCSQNGQNDRKRKRTSITDSEKRALEAYFAVQPRPSSEKIAQIADKLNLKKNVVRVWFCNQRQKQKRMKFANQAAGTGDGSANSPAADTNQSS